MINKVEKEALIPLLQSFLDSSTQDATPRQNKTIRLRKTYNGKLMDEAHARSKELGRRVTESDVVDEALTLLFEVRALIRTA